MLLGSRSLCCSADFCACCCCWLRAQAQETRVVLDRGGSTIVLEPYAPNIIRVTLSLLKQPALGCSRIWFYCRTFRCGMEPSAK